MIEETPGAEIAQTRRLELKLRAFYAKRTVPADRRAPQAEVALKSGVDHLGRTWELMFQRYLPHRTLGRWRWPRTWWDAVKERWFPSWALRRWPASYSGVDLSRVADVPLPPGTPTYWVLTQLRSGRPEDAALEQVPIDEVDLRQHELIEEWERLDDESVRRGGMVTPCETCARVRLFASWLRDGAR